MSTRTVPAGSLWAEIPRLTTLLGAAVAAVLPLAVPDRLIPEQLDAIRPILSVAAVVALLGAWAFQRRLAGRAGLFVGIAAAGCLALAAVHLTLVQTVGNLGTPPGTYHFLVGFRLTEEGRAFVENAGLAGSGRETWVRAAGSSRIPWLYGWTYAATAGTFAAASLALVGGVVLSLAAAGLHSPATLPPDTNAASSPPAPGIGVLFLAANPVDTTPLRLGEEVRTIDERLREGTLRDRIHIDQQWATRLADLSQALLRHQPHIVHFSGHGSDAGRLIFEDAAGDSDETSIEAIAGLFAVLRDNVRCVVLNACFSDAQARALAVHIDCVVGTTRAIGDDAAVRFAGGFYRALGFGRSIATAFDLGRGEIALADQDDKDTPQLICRPGVDAGSIHLI